MRLAASYDALVPLPVFQALKAFRLAAMLLMLQGCFLARDHSYICDKFAHGPTEKDGLLGYISQLVRCCICSCENINALV